MDTIMQLRCSHDMYNTLILYETNENNIIKINNNIINKFIFVGNFLLTE